MKIVHVNFPFDFRQLPEADRGKAIAIGHFDGVHRGHQDVIGGAVKAAREEGLLPAVMTFHPHPKQVLGQGRRDSLTPLPDKLALFERLGVELTYVFRFDLALAAVTPEAFVASVLRPLGVRQAVVGFDFSFGNKGAGTPELLRALGHPDLAVRIVPPLVEDGSKISSSRIREALQAGEVERAAKLLGRRYSVTGRVVPGFQRGRTIGFPTANIDPEDKYTLPRLGVYAVYANVDGERYSAVMNLGVKPTFEDGEEEPKLEAHLFDFDGDLYGRRMTIEFAAFLRPERKFASVDELIAQIGRDADAARSVLAARA